MKITNLDIVKSEKRFAFLSINRSVKSNKALRESIVKKGVLNPLIIMNASDIDDDTMLYDGADVLKGNARKFHYVVLDGQHRYNELMALVRQEEAKMKKNAEYVSNLKTTLPCLLMTKEDVGDVNEFMIELNSCSKNWRSVDYIENAHKVVRNDELIETINFFKEKGFAISVISRFICFDNKKLNNKSLADYTNNRTPIADADPQRAMKLYKFLIFIGFSDVFLKKRYVIDYIIRQSRISSLNEVLMKLSKLRRAGSINSLRDKDSDISIEIERIVNEDFATFCRDEELTQQDIDNLKNKDYLADVPDEDMEGVDGHSKGELLVELAKTPAWVS